MNSTTLGGPVSARSISDQASPARDRISGTEEHLNDLHIAFDRLEARLDTILTPVPPDVSKASGTPAQPTTPKSHVVGRLEMLNEGFHHLAVRIERLYSRIEL